MALVTKEWLRDYIDTQPPTKVAHMIGRALVVLHQRQTAGEQASKTTTQQNGVGFTSADAYSGSATALSFLKRGSLKDWQVEKWTRRGKNGWPRIAKYHRQLNEAAEVKAGR